MKTCPTCKKTILWGGIKKGNKHYCCAECYRSANPNAKDADTVKDSLSYRIVSGFGIAFGVVIFLWIVGNFIYFNFIKF